MKLIVLDPVTQMSQAVLICQAIKNPSPLME